MRSLSSSSCQCDCVYAVQQQEYSLARMKVGLLENRTDWCGDVDSSSCCCCCRCCRSDLGQERTSTPGQILLCAKCCVTYCSTVLQTDRRHQCSNFLLPFLCGTSECTVQLLPSHTPALLVPANGINI